MKLFYDTNVLLDQFDQRREGFPVVSQIDDIIMKGSHTIMCSWHSLSILEYVGRKALGKEVIGMVLRNIVKTYEIPATGKLEAKEAFQYISNDYEDAMQISAAVVGRADYIVTSDKSGFSNSPITVVTPRELLKLLR